MDEVGKVSVVDSGLGKGLAHVLDGEQEDSQTCCINPSAKSVCRKYGSESHTTHCSRQLRRPPHNPPGDSQPPPPYRMPRGR